MSFPKEHSLMTGFRKAAGIAAIAVSTAFVHDSMNSYLGAIDSQGATPSQESSAERIPAEMASLFALLVTCAVTEKKGSAKPSL